MITRRDIINDTISNGAGGACEGGYSSGNSGSCAIIKPATVTRNQQLTECTLDTYAIESQLNRDMEERETSLREWLSKHFYPFAGIVNLKHLR